MRVTNQLTRVILSRSEESLSLPIRLGISIGISTAMTIPNAYDLAVILRCGSE